MIKYRWIIICIINMGLDVWAISEGILVIGIVLLIIWSMVLGKELECIFGTNPWRDLVKRQEKTMIKMDKVINIQNETIRDYEARSSLDKPSSKLTRYSK